MKDDRPRIDGKFYPLQNDEWVKAWGELKPAEVQVLYHLRTLDPFGEKELELGVSAIALRLGLSCSEEDQEFRPTDLRPGSLAGKPDQGRREPLVRLLREVQGTGGEGEKIAPQPQPGD